MAQRTVPSNLQTALEERCQRVFKPRSTVLFRRGEKAYGMFLVLTGNITLDFGVDAAHGRCYGPGALVGLPASLTKGAYSMTATVTENAVLGFLPLEAIEHLLRDHPHVCQELLSILGERVQEIQRLTKSILEKGQQPHQVSCVV
jgi:CRP-like cAMP-binding protein